MTPGRRLRATLVRRRRERGFALLVVLWSLVFLAFLMTQILAASRTADSLAENSRFAAQVRAAEDGAIDEAVLHLLESGAGHWAPDGTVHGLTIGGVPVLAQARSLAGMINPNLASQAQLAGLIRAVAVPAAQASDIATAIVEWRSPPDSRQAGQAQAQAYGQAGLPYAPPARPFGDLSELSFVLGMTPAILAALTPHMSLFQPGDPTPALADPVVLQALAIAKVTDAGGSDYEGAPTVRISACARAVPTSCRHESVGLPGLAALNPYQVLALGDGR